MLVLACVFACPTYDIQFFHSESSSLASLHSIVCPGFGKLKFFFYWNFVWVAHFSQFEFVQHDHLGSLIPLLHYFLQKLKCFEVSFGPTYEVVGSTMDSLSEEF